MNSSEQLRTAAKRRVSPKSGDAVRLGDVITELLEQRLSAQQRRFESISELWQELLPANLYVRCRIVDISSGELKVLADSPSFATELNWRRSDLLEELRQRCPQARIKRIKVSVG